MHLIATSRIFGSAAGIGVVNLPRIPGVAVMIENDIAKSTVHTEDFAPTHSEQNVRLILAHFAINILEAALIVNLVATALNCNLYNTLYTPVTIEFYCSDPLLWKRS